MIKTKGIIAVFLILIILVTAGYMFQNRENLFTNKGTIVYPDGCIENYVNNELVGDSCDLINESLWDTDFEVIYSD